MAGIGKSFGNHQTNDELVFRYEYAHCLYPSLQALNYRGGRWILAALEFDGVH
jgi:hypothetical protein